MEDPTRDNAGVRLITFDAGDGPRPGALAGDEVADLSPVARSVAALLEVLDRARDAPAGGLERRPLASVRLLAPLRPASLRDFLAFEDHSKAGAARRGEELNPAWYRRPVYYKGNHREIVGPGEDLRRPAFTRELDFELELACVVGAAGRDLSEEEAARVIAGYTVMNDWSARDVQDRKSVV